MKTKLTLLFCFVLALFSCKKELNYSCDPSIDDWAKENIDEIRLMSRESFIKLPDGKFQAAYRVFGKTKRIAVWKSKLEEVLSEKWSDAERQHIHKLLEFINAHEDYFGDINPTKLQARNDEVSLFSYAWMDFSKETFGWTDKIIFDIAGSPAKFGTLRPDFEIINGGGIGNPDCRCRVGWAGCSPGTCIANKNNCKLTTPGCGLVWLQECDGMCGV